MNELISYGVLARALRSQQATASKATESGRRQVTYVRPGADPGSLFSTHRRR